MFFRKLLIKGFPPFEDQEITLPKVEIADGSLAETHVITGVNGTGKTRLLSVMAAVLGSNEHIAKRWPDPKGTVFVNKLVELSLAKSKSAHNTASVYCDNTSSNGIFLGRDEWKAFASTLAFAYNGLAYVQDAAIKPMVATQKPDAKIRLSFARPPEQSAALLQNIANLKIHAAMDHMNAADSAETTPMRLMNKLESAITDITGRSFKFDVETYGGATICVRWGGSEKFQFALLPDGLRSIIGWLAHAVAMMDACLEGKSDPTEQPAIFLLDEPESHLHPAWQRKILPAFQKLFPKSQVIVSTHSPFVISSINQGWIHRLVVNPFSGKVHAEEPKPAEAGDSYMSVVEDLMGLEPIQAFDPESEKLLAAFYATRKAAYDHEPEAVEDAERIGGEIAKRGSVLALIVGNELSQMRRQLAHPKVEV